MWMSNVYDYNTFHLLIHVCKSAVPNSLWNFRQRILSSSYRIFCDPSMCYSNALSNSWIKKKWVNRSSIAQALASSVCEWWVRSQLEMERLFEYFQVGRAGFSCGNQFLSVGTKQSNQQQRSLANAVDNWSPLSSAISKNRWFTSVDENIWLKTRKFDFPLQHILDYDKGIIPYA